jgi:hypothetical protein
VPEYDYHYLALADAEEHISKPERAVWYYREDEEDPPQCTSVEEIPGDAVAVVVASPTGTITDEILMGQVNFLRAKDPLPPPPPPPPWPDSLTGYLEQSNVQEFFPTEAMARDTPAATEARATAASRSRSARRAVG